MDTKAFDLRHDVDFNTILSAFCQLFGLQIYRQIFKNVEN